MISMFRTKESKMAVWIVFAFLFLAALPLFVIAHFNYPCSDDFAFADALYKAISDGNSINIVIQRAWEEAVSYYKRWQGCYFNNVLSSFGIGIAIPEYYFMGTYLVLILFIMSNLSFFRTVTYRICRWNTDVSWIFTVLITSMQILYVPYPSEAFFWYVGATAYTMTYSLLLFLGTSIIWFYYADCLGKRMLSCIVAIFLAFIIGGSNYSTGLLTAELLVLAFLIMFLKRKRSSFLGIVLIEYLVCFVVFNALAPSNAGRMGAVESLGVTGSILASLLQGMVFLKEWFRLPVLIFLAVIFILGAAEVVKMNFSFRLPGVVSLISFGVFCSMMTPPFFAGATWGPGRLINLVYFSYYFLLAGNLLYWTGWVSHKYEKSQLILQKEMMILPILICFLGLFLLCLKIYGLQSTSSSSALLSLAKGEATIYLEENRQRWEIYENNSVMDVEVMDFDIKPYVLYHDDIVEDETDWRNHAVANFFGKDSVKLKK